MVNQGCMSLSIYYLEYGSHFARLRRRRRRRAYGPTSNTASHDNHDKISMGLRLRSAIKNKTPCLITCPNTGTTWSAETIFKWWG